MLQIYDMGNMIMSANATNNIAKKYVDKLNELGLCNAYDSNDFTFNTSTTNGSITGTQNITFKDSTKINLLFFIPTVSNNSYPEYSNTLKTVMFVDEEEHFVLCSTAISTFLNTKTSESMQYFIHAMCFDDWYGNGIMYEGNVSTNSQSHLNVPTVKLENSLGNDFILYPIYMVPENAIPKNLYFSPNKTYPVGTVMTDTAGNQFVSVVPRFLYKTN